MESSESDDLEVAARIFLQTPTDRHSLTATSVLVGDVAVQRVAQRLAEGSPALRVRLRYAVSRHRRRPTSRTRDQVVEAVTCVALSLALGEDTRGYEPLMEGEVG